MKKQTRIMATVIFAIACAIVVLIGTITAPLALDKELDAKKQYFQLLYPAAKVFTPISVSGNTLNAAYLAEQNGEKVGIIYEVVVNGYKDDIVFYVAINRDGTLEKPVYSIVNDTPGIGTKIETDSDFLDQYLETNVSDFYLDTISSATISSQAVVEGTENAVKAFQQMQTVFE
ncbi:MAG: FMN-binding protein [Culicoidibacterales bacterium]